MILAPINRDGTISGYVGHVPGIGQTAIQSTVELYSRVGWILPWIGYLAIEQGVCVGTCAFTSAPKNNVVEIAYFTFPGNEGRGIATRMAALLISLAKESASGIVVTAHTLPKEGPSTRILHKLNFLLEGSRVHEEDGQIWVWRHRGPVVQPDKLPEPMSPVVTPPAGAGGAPSVAADH
jgi:[ribosomal protein S5]-alanine N-acetyltransferase